VRVLLATLPDRFRVPIECVKLEGLTVAETAQRTGMSASAVKIGVHRGLRLLARRLREGTDEDSAMKTREEETR